MSSRSRSLGARVRRAPGRRALLGVSALALVGLLALAGCGLGPGPTPGGISLSVTQDFGALPVGYAGTPRASGQETVMSLLMRNYQIKTRYGGGFVESINGHSGGTQAGEPIDWFYYVNGVEAPKGAAETNVRSGDRIWWDLHDWSQTDNIPAVVGSFPEPLVGGIEGKRYPVRVECSEPSGSACATVHARLSALGVPVAGAAVSDEEEQLTIRVLVGPYSALGDSLSVHDIGAGPHYSGVYARFSDGGSVLSLLDPAGSVVRKLGAGAGLIAATRYGGEAPVWLVTGTDAAGVKRAANSLRESTLHNCFALALEPSGTPQPVPVAGP
jgi:Domain of unknown function (DUF4430)